MFLKFSNCSIRDILLVLPAVEHSYLEDMGNFDAPLSRSKKLADVMGYDKRRIVSPDTCSSDLAVFGLQHLFDTEVILPHEIDALIVVTQTPDHFIPPTSFVIQGELKLKKDMICLDLVQGCAGFILGLIQAFMLLGQQSIDKVALINVDVLSRKVSSRDRNSFPLVGDAASITIIEKGGNEKILASIKVDGTGRDALIIPAGGMRLPSTIETSVVHDYGNSNHRALDHLVMDGSAVFNFVQTEIPSLISEIISQADLTDADIDAYVFHQPNRFMLEKLADKMKVPHSKMPMNVVERFGNNSGVTIPTVLATNLAESLIRKSGRYCLAGFGVGLTQASVIMGLGPVNSCNVIEYAR